MYTKKHTHASTQSIEQTKAEEGSVFQLQSRYSREWAQCVKSLHQTTNGFSGFCQLRNVCFITVICHFYTPRLTVTDNKDTLKKKKRHVTLKACNVKCFWRIIPPGSRCKVTCWYGTPQPRDKAKKSVNIYCHGLSPIGWAPYSKQMVSEACSHWCSL